MEETRLDLQLLQEVDALSRYKRRTGWAYSRKFMQWSYSFTEGAEFSTLRRHGSGSAQSWSSGAWTSNHHRRWTA